MVAADATTRGRHALPCSYSWCTHPHITSNANVTLQPYRSRLPASPLLSRSPLLWSSPLLSPQSAGACLAGPQQTLATHLRSPITSSYKRQSYFAWTSPRLTAARALRRTIQPPQTSVSCDLYSNFSWPSASPTGRPISSTTQTSLYSPPLVPSSFILPPSQYPCIGICLSPFRASSVDRRLSWRYRLLHHVSQGWSSSSSHTVAAPWPCLHPKLPHKTDDLPPVVRITRFAV